MKSIIEVKGKAKQVFKYVELLGIYKGNMTLKQLVKEGKTIKVDLRT